MTFLPSRRDTYMYSLDPDEAVKRTKEGVEFEVEKKKKDLRKKVLAESGSEAYSDLVANLMVTELAIQKDVLWSSCWVDVYNVESALRNSNAEEGQKMDKFTRYVDKIFAG